MASTLKNNSLDKIQPILVTGGSGYIGTHVVATLREAGYKVKIFDQFMYGDTHIDDFKKDKGIEIIKGEVGDVPALITAMVGTQAVIHLAGLVGDPACAVDEGLTEKMNIVSARIVKELAKVFNLKRFVFASSCSVYGATNRVATERSRLNPVSLYARTKIDSEKEILGDKSPDFHPTVLRFATVFGDSRRPRFDLVANLFVAQAYNDGVLTVEGGNQWRPFVHPQDIARAILLVLEAPLKKVDHEIFNVGDKSLNMTIGDLARLVASIVKKDKKDKSVRVSINDKIVDKRNYKVSFDKISRVLKFRTKMDLQGGLYEIYSNFKKGKYKENYKDPFYINVEMTKLLQAGKIL